MDALCGRCEMVEGEVERARARMAELEANLLLCEQERDELRVQLAQALTLAELAQADVARMAAEMERQQPNRPERVAKNELQLAFDHVLDLFPQPAANENGAAPSSEPDSPPPAPPPAPPPPRNPGGRGRHAHGRRRLDLTTLPVERVTVDPKEVMATGGEGWKRIGEEVSDRLAYRPASYIRLQIVRPKWVLADHVVAADAANAEQVVADAASETAEALEVSPVRVAPLPESVWPQVMADPSVTAHIATAKYGDYLPLNRQERISARDGFVIPRGTQCSWLAAGYFLLYRIVDAMLAEAKAKAFCIAHDSTGAPVRAKGACDLWHLFVFIADQDHVIFRHSRDHTGAVVHEWLKGYRGFSLADATSILDVVYRMEAIIEVACWAHLRRYAYKALAAQREAALQALSIIGKLFEIDAACRSLPFDERTARRAELSRPILALFDEWAAHYEGKADPRGPLERVITYYRNQRTALWRFLEDGRLRLDNNISEQQLRAAVLGRANWTFFANENGLRWYTTYRSLIASCALHQLNPELYLEQVLRLAPHWPATRMIELAPKYWPHTLAGLDARHCAIVTRPWDLEAAISVAPATETEDAHAEAA